MTRKTLKLPEEDYERHNERRKEMGLSWAEYVDGQAPDIEETVREAVREEVHGDGCRFMECPRDATHGLLYLATSGDEPTLERYCERHARIAAEDAHIDGDGEVIEGPAPLEELE